MDQFSFRNTDNMNTPNEAARFREREMWNMIVSACEHRDVMEADFSKKLAMVGERARGALAPHAQKCMEERAERLDEFKQRVENGRKQRGWRARRHDPLEPDQDFLEEQLDRRARLVSRRDREEQRNIDQYVDQSITAAKHDADHLRAEHTATVFRALTKSHSHMILAEAAVAHKPDLSGLPDHEFAVELADGIDEQHKFLRDTIAPANGLRGYERVQRLQADFIQSSRGFFLEGSSPLSAAGLRDMIETAQASLLAVSSGDLMVLADTVHIPGSWTEYAQEFAKKVLLSPMRDRMLDAAMKPFEPPALHEPSVELSPVMANAPTRDYVEQGMGRAALRRSMH